MPSRVISSIRAVAHGVFLNMSLPRQYIAGSMSMPARLPIKRQPKGFMPKMRIPSDIIALPSGGCVHSYMRQPFIIS